MKTQDAFVVRGVNVIGFESYYTGKAGPNFVNSSIQNAFPYETAEGARRKASVLNHMSEMHGWRFVAVSRINDEMRSADMLECIRG